MATAKDRLFKAVEAGPLEAFQQAATELDGDIRQLHADNGANCLHIAAYAGQSELCKYLLDQLHFNIDSQDGTGSTALLLALTNDHVPTAELLLSYGPDVNRCGSGEAAAAPLHLAVAAEHLELTREIIAKGADVNMQGASGSPLMLAVARSNTPLVELLLGAGAAVHEAGQKGLTPLFMAVAVGGSVECVEALIKAGADVNSRALGAFTPLHVAAEAGKQGIVEALLKAGANPEARDEHGHTPARVAGMHNHRGVVEVLLRRSGSAAGSSGGSGEAAGSSNIDEFMKSSKKDLKEREERAASSKTAGGATVVRIPEPECPDEALSDQFKRKGNEFFVSGDYAGAAKLYELALSHWTKNSVVWSNRAACYLRLDRFDKAMQDAQIARTLDPNYVKAWYREGRAAEGLKRWEDAATAYYQAAQLQPDNEEFMRLTKEAIMEGRKEYEAQQQQPAAAGESAAGASGASGAGVAAGGPAAAAAAAGQGEAVKEDGPAA